MSSSQPVRILRLNAEAAKVRIDELAAILLDCVSGGASVSFMDTMDRREAKAFWRKVIKGVEAGGRILIGAEQAGRLVGTVQAVASGIPNQPHRSDLSKMLVHREARGQGVGALLLKAAEDASRDAGMWLMVLDTVVESSGDRLYARGGWKPVGIVPNFALWPDGRLCATRYYFKDLRPSRGISVREETPDQYPVLAMLEAGNAEMAKLYPAESNHMIDLAELQQANVSFFVARRSQNMPAGYNPIDADIVAIGALRNNGDGSGELKRFFTDPHLRGQGVGSSLLKAVETKARASGITKLQLETGFLSASALALYRANGFIPTEAFAPYKPDPWSVFMVKEI
jgi:GNAT superfamily N-acetyltransferase